MDPIKESICKNIDYIIKNTTNTEKVVKCLKEKNILTTSQPVDLRHVIEEVLRKNESDAFVAALKETGNEEVEKKITTLSEKGFENFVGGAQVETNQDMEVKRNSTLSVQELKRIADLESKNNELTAQINHLTTVQKGVRQEIEDKRKRITELLKLEDENHKLKQDMLLKEKVLLEKDAKIIHYEKQISSLEKMNSDLTMELEGKNKQLFGQNKEVEDLKKQMEVQNHKMHEMKTEMSEMKDTMNVKFDQILTLMQTNQTTEQTGNKYNTPRRASKHPAKFDLKKNPTK